jgi:cation-transporting ATPase 13A1
MDELKKEMNENDPRLVQLGDASIASPFTSKSSSVIPVTHIIRQGRCTLVTTYQMFRILALSCLINAYSLSVLNLAGIKLGDTQMTVTGILIAMCFLFITRSGPLESLSPKRPLGTLFTKYLFLSIIGQFVIHLVSLVYLVDQAESYRVGDRPKPDADFAPNLVNSVVFLIMTSMQIITFAVNYEGHPFMESIPENKGLLYCLSLCAAIIIITATEVMPDFNKNFDMVALPTALKPKILLVLAADALGAFTIEKTARLLFY